ncbi:MAG TPA: hypothetical protein VHK91_04390 [Flavisolibacter sp.]|jgi:hypothetical protein|nr:hypothetical protein [Flavisolibacter sp.]
MLRIAIWIVLALLTSCSNDIHQLKVTSSYVGTIDSLIFNINFKQVAKLQNIPSGLDTTLTFSAKDIAARHDVIVWAALYYKGPKIDSVFCFNDFGYIPEETIIHIDESLKLSLITIH